MAPEQSPGGNRPAGRRLRGQTRTVGKDALDAAATVGRAMDAMDSPGSHPLIAADLPHGLPVAGTAGAAGAAEQDAPLVEGTARLEASRHFIDRQLAQLSSRLHAAEQARDAESARAEDLAAQLAGVLDLVPGGAVLIDAAGVVGDANPQALDLLGQPLLGERWQAVVGRNVRPRSDDGHEVSLADGRRVSVTTRPLPGGHGQLVHLADRTGTRALQAEVSRNERLTAMGRMLAALAHQLRTPLSTAMLYAGQLCGGGLSGAQRERFGAQLGAALRHLERQIRDMLLFARGEIAVAEVVSVGELVDTVQAAMGQLARDPAVTWRWQVAETGQRLPCNLDVLAGAILNLLTNAVQAGAASSADTVVEVRVLRVDDELAIAVTDNGPGIPEHLLERLQEPFFTTRSNGTGLGLAVVRAVAKAHGGRFSLDNVADGQGARAVLYLPVAEPQPGNAS